MMLIEIGFRPNNLFISNSSKYFPTYCPPYAHISHEVNTKSRPMFFNPRKKKLVKRSVTMPSAEDGTQEGKPISKCLEATENDFERPGARHRCFNPFKGARTWKEVSRGKVSDADGFVGGGNRLAIEFPMILNIGSVYSSHVVVYLDP